MSDGESSDRDGRPVDVVDDMAEEDDTTVAEYAPPISALPPRVMLQEESQMEVSASPAFQCLDDVSCIRQADNNI